MVLLKFGLISPDKEVVTWSLRCLGGFFGVRGAQDFFDQNGIEIIYRSIAKHPDMKVDIIGFMLEFVDWREFFDRTLREISQDFLDYINKLKVILQVSYEVEEIAERVLF